ncbi:hypothetical protein Llac01_03770 [Leuconostoc lactis]|nr:hypothetical protein LLA04_04460 [Leuconostoc lactis]GLY45000.1 hypothetical protein Llac01_03770 [Leuconostoc lactis]
MTGALPFLQKDWHLTDAGTIGWITLSLMLGAIVGGALAGQLSDKLGRRLMILAASFIFAIGSVMAGISPNDGVAWLLIARTLLGLAVGAASALVPSYMSEMAPARTRGRLSGLNQLMIVSGILLSYIVDYLLQGLPHDIAWRLMLGLAAVPAVILCLGVLRLPESPRFLVKTGHIDAARRVSTYIRPGNEVAGELADIQRTVAVEDGAIGSQCVTLANRSRCYLGLGCDLVYGDRRQVQASDTLDAWWDYHGVIFLNASNLKHGCRGREFATNADRCLPLNLCGLLLLHLGTIDLGLGW